MASTTLDRVIQRRHPEYADNQQHWDFLLASYHGGRSWFDDNIHPYYKEGDSNYQLRKDRAYRFNHTREVVDLVNKYLFRAKVVRNTNDAPECLINYWKDATGKGVPIDEFAKHSASQSSTVGRVWTVI